LEGGQVAVPTRLGRAIVLAVLACASPAAAELIPTLKLAAEERYDNAYLPKPSDVGQTTGIAGQMITKLSTQVGLDIKERTLNVHSFYAPDFFLQSGSGYSGVDHRGLIDLKNDFSHRFSLDGKVEIWRVSDPTVLPQIGIARTFSPLLYGAAQLAGAERLSPRTTLRAGYRFEGAKNYDPDPRFRSAGFAHVPFAELWYRLSQRSDIGVEYRFQYLTFENSASDANTVSALYRYRFSPETKFTLKVGPTYYQKLDSNPLDVSKSGWMPRLTFEFTHDIRGSEIGLALGHELAGAIGLTSGLWFEYVSVFTTQRLSKEFSVFGGATVYRNGPAASLYLDSFHSTDQTAEGYWLNGGLEWRLMRSASLNGIFTRISQVAGSAGIRASDLSRNIFAIRLVYTAL
jgi:hypothetical protein